MHTTTTANRRRTVEGEATRNELFASDTPTPSLRKRARKSSEGEEQVAQSLTEDLIELRQMMHTQLEHGQDTVKLLANSSSKISETKRGMEEIDVNIKVGQGLLSKLGRRDLTDKVLIFLALIFFFSVVLYIIKKRLIGWII